ncbi:hypothetical protein [Halarchaeum salinum]|uniref:C2H2-type domain-containing protein n=1 Tax=Halarchaeum salinum TaxID=489912 RepID=A0AAV3S4S7_9EURY
MTLRIVKSSGGSIKVSLIECPACGADLSGRKKPSAHLLTEHVPEDFGLSAPGRRVVADGGER